MSPVQRHRKHPLRICADAAFAARNQAVAEPAIRKSGAGARQFLSSYFHGTLSRLRRQRPTLNSTGDHDMSTERDAELARELSQNESLKAIDEAMPARLERLKKIEQIRRRNLRRQMWGSLCTMLVLVILVTF